METDDVYDTIKTDYRNGELGKLDHEEEGWIKDHKLKLFLDEIKKKKELEEAENTIKNYHKKYG